MDTIELVKQRAELLWLNDEKKNISKTEKQELGAEETADAAERLKRFAPVISYYFPETQKNGGIIESPLTEIPKLKDRLNEKYTADIKGRLFIKEDSNLQVAGSVKARGGIYEVLKHTEDLAIENGILQSTSDDYLKLTTSEARKYFGSCKIQVGSTGNLGMSIGIMSAALGYEAIIHMSADAKEWKKTLLRSKGAKVVEYNGDYGEAVKKGRALSAADSTSYFVDDENSKDLFLGYAVAGERLQIQLKEAGITVDDEHPLFVYIPCGVGGAPGGITFGLRQIFGDNVHCFFVEPTEAPCMLLGLATGKENRISVQDVGLSGKTHADGLACGSPSGLSCRMMRPHLSGIFTITDKWLYEYLRDLYESEGIFIEPSSCAAIRGVTAIGKGKYIGNIVNAEKMPNATHIIWATGGSFVPKEMREEFLKLKI